MVKLGRAANYNHATMRAEQMSSAIAFIAPVFLFRGLFRIDIFMETEQRFS